MVDLKSETLKLPFFPLWAFWVKEIDKVNAYEIIQYIFHQKWVSYIFNLLSMDIFSCAVMVFSEFLIIFKLRAFFQSSEFRFSFIGSVLVCHLLKIPKIKHLNKCPHWLTASCKLICSLFPIEQNHYTTEISEIWFGIINHWKMSRK